MTDTPRRIVLSRKPGWRLPPNTIKVDRSSKWGNPFVIGQDGTREQCVRWFELLMGGMVCMSLDVHPRTQREYFEMVQRDRHQLVGKNLACWCPINVPCHADVLLKIAAKTKAVV